MFFVPKEFVYTLNGSWVYTVQDNNMILVLQNTMLFHISICVFAILYFCG